MKLKTNLMAYVAAIAALIPLATNAQETAKTVTHPKDWYLKSWTKDSLFGTEVNRAYSELLQGKKTRKTTIVAIMDSGLDTLHEDLHANLWQNPKEHPGTIDRDHNGYPGDVRGWNFLGNAHEQLLIENTERIRTYFRYRARFEKLENGNKLSKRDRELYSSWQESAKQLQPFFEMMHKQKNISGYMTNEQYGTWKDFRSKVIRDDETNLKQRYYGNANLTGLGHGTHVAGIVGAVRNNGIGMDGIANDVRLMGVRVVPSDGDEYDKDVALGVRYAVDNGADIINMSFSKSISPNRQLVEDAILYAAKKGVLIVWSAGNDETDIDSIVKYPSPFYLKAHKKYPNVIVVGNSDSFYKSTGSKPRLISTSSNYGAETVDVFAPGVEIYSTIPKNGYKAYSGTSMAAPVVSGIAALIKSYYPDLKAKQLKYIIEQSVTKIDFPVDVGSPFSYKRAVKQMNQICTSGGIVNAYNALKLAEEMSKH